MQIAIKFDVTESRRYQRKVYGCRIGETIDVEASSKTELAAKVKQEIESRMVRFPTALVRVGDEIRIVTAMGPDTTDILRPCDNEQQGLVLLTTTGTSSEDVVDCARRQVLHLAQQAWEGDGTPAYLTDEQKRDFESWVRFQTAYRIALDSGFSSRQSHELACDAMHA